jgi:hypothetical protein
MNLPNYFLADLPPQATVSAAMLREACVTLRRNREQYLVPRSTENVVNVLAGLGKSWLQPDYAFRKLALEGAKGTGFSGPTLAAGLDSFFRQLTREGLHSLLEQDLGNTQRLDRMAASEAEQKSSRASIGSGPELMLHIAAGNLPSPALHSLVLGFITRSAQVLKCATGTSLIPRLFAHSLYESDPKLGACLEVAEWQGGNAELEQALYAGVDCVTATGSDATLQTIRKQLPNDKRFLGYGQRVSFGFVSSRVLSGLNVPKIVTRAATDVVAWNQLGCLSPHVIYVELGGGHSPEQFAEKLAEELERRENSEPRGDLPVEVASTITLRRSLYEVRAAHSPDTRHWCSQNSTAWTVVYEVDPRFQLSCLNRFIYVKGVKDLTEALQSADEVRSKTSTVGIAATEDQAEEVATILARWGVTRVCPLGQMQNPSLAWRHDGHPALGDLVRWTDWEM